MSETDDAFQKLITALGQTPGRDHFADVAANVWWIGVQDQWKHRPIGNRIPETENPYTGVHDE